MLSKLLSHEELQSRHLKTHSGLKRIFKKSFANEEKTPRMVSDLESTPSSDEPESPAQLANEENIEDYCEGGYNPTFIGEKYGGMSQYTIVRKLGWGNFSTVWLAYDSLRECHVAIKIVRSSKIFRHAALDEVKILQKVRESSDLHPGKKHIVEMLDHFTHYGPNGEHICMVFEVLGESVLGLLARFRKYQHKKSAEQCFGGLPIPLARQISKQILIALDYLHRECGLIHTDLKPENVLIEIKDVEKFVKCQQNEWTKPVVSVKHPTGHRSRKSVSKSREMPPSPLRSSQPLTSPMASSTEELDRLVCCCRDERRPSMKPPQTEPIAEEDEDEEGDFFDAKETVEKAVENGKLEQETRATAVGKDAVEAVETEKTATGSPTIAKTNPHPQKMIPQNLPKLITDSDFDDYLDGIISVKIADLGNSCWQNKHYSRDIQTRQYRSPEVILGADYGCSTDVWSAGCLFFELLTGDYLFDPTRSETFSKDEDHLAQIFELLNEFPPREMITKCVKAPRFFEKYNGSLRLQHIHNLKIWLLKDVLMEKYKMDSALAAELCDLLLKMLVISPGERENCGMLVKSSFINCSNVFFQKEDIGVKGETIPGWAATAHE